MNKYLIIVFFLIINSACFDPAGRDNPLDPESGIYSPQGRIQGYVNAYYQTDQPVAGAAIYLYPSGNYEISSEDGYFEFNRLPAGKYKIKAVRKGYRSDSTEVDIDNNIREIQLQLNGHPVIEQVILQTHHISRWWPSEDLYYISVDAYVEDPDGATDIDSVWVEVPTGGNIFPLTRTGQNGEFSKTVTDQELFVPSLYYLQGKPIMVYCRDLLDNQGESEKMYIPRIIEQIPVLVYPTDLASINNSPITFEWEPLYLGFPYKYKFEIYQINLGVYNKIYEIDELPGNTQAYTFTNMLDQGDYFWVLYIIDEFGDSSRSKEGAFRIIRDLN